MRRRIFEMVLFALLGAIMFFSKLLMDALPNIHLLAMLTVTYTVVFRWKALIPIYVNVVLVGVYGGFSTWWIPYLYLWTVLWGITMLLPKKMPPAVAAPVYMVTCALHGFLYGTLYAPVQALAFGLSFEAMKAWIIAGLPFDFIHGVSNFFIGILVLPVSIALKKALNAVK